MDADERLTALKKAYADIILNTAKEAAARIMVSERKALTFQHELRVAKEEALQMLLRLKHMMDAKVSEAELKSLSQLGKIEELEAQLQEAEDIVKDLRDELREVQAELERVRINKAQHWSEHDTAATLEEISEEGRLYGSKHIIFYPPVSQCESITATDVTNSDMNQTSEDHKCYSSISHMENSYTGSPDSPSVTLRSKEPQLCRNGCTQRIRACERNLLHGELSLNGHLNDGKIDSKIRTNEEGKQTSKVATYEADRMSNLLEEVAALADGRLRSQCQVHPVKSFHKTRKRATRCKKNRTPSRRHLPGGYMKVNQPPNISCLKFHLNEVSIDSHYDEDHSKVVQRPSLDVVEVDPRSGCAETSESKAEFANACGIGNKKNEVIYDMVPTSQESASTESLAFPACRMVLEKADVPLVNSGSKASDMTIEIPCQPVNDRIIKYTFQRKRKKESLSSPDRNLSLERITLKKKMGEKQNGSLEPQKSNLITESSRDIQQQAEIARQLLSLADKKWWH